MRLEFGTDRLVSVRMLGHVLHDLASEADRLFASTAALLRSWQARSHQRRQLCEMEDERLRDIGLSRVDAVRESSKLFWRR